MNSALLTCRSYYSLLRGAVSPGRLIARAGECGYKAVALADVNGMYGIVEFWKAAQEAGIGAIVGVEILTDSQRAVLLAETREGYRNLCRITTARQLGRDFDIVEQLGRYGQGVICVSAQRWLLEQLREFVGRDSLFAGCLKAADAAWAGHNGIKAIAWNTYNVIDEADIVTGRLLGRIRKLSTTGEGPQDDCGFNSIVPVTELQRRFAECPVVLEHANDIAERCQFQLLDGMYHLPSVHMPGASGAEKPAVTATGEVNRGVAEMSESERHLARLCHVGLARRYKPVSAEVIKRLEHELAVIRANRFSDYFLVVYEIVNYAKRKGIPVDVRGSAAGSLVTYTLGMTRVCPVENNLYFERFMNEGRRDCPDIDIDLCWRKRDDVIRFCYENWGRDHVAMISTINCYRRRSAIRDVGRALGLHSDEVAELLDKDCKTDDCASLQLANSIIGTPRHLGIHCGGIVITPSPIHTLAPLERATKGVIITQYDKNAAEALGLVKIDLLGNRSLSTANEAVCFIGQSGKAVDIDGFDGNDKKTATMLSNGDSLGVFQCESPGMRQLLRALKVRNQRDIAIALSLIRPGPAAGGMKTEFIERHVNHKPFDYLHGKMAEVLKDTCGVMLYQEDIMRIAVEVAGYSVAEANTFRTEVSSKVPAARLQGQYRDFVYHRAPKAGIGRDEAEAIWDQILRFASYSFCKAHATVYANIAWQTAFLKAHYPLQFHASLLRNHHGMYPLRVYVWDAIRHGLKVVGPHVNYSDKEWGLQGKAIRAGLGIVKGLSNSTIESIVRQRQQRAFVDLNDLRMRVRFRHGELAGLIQVGACDELGVSRPAMLIESQYRWANQREGLLFDPYVGPSLAELPDYDRIARLGAEIRLTGIPFSMHPALLLSGRQVQARQLSRFVNHTVTVGGFLATARTAKTNVGKTMGFVTIEDSTGLAEVSFFPDQMVEYRRIRKLDGKPVWVTGKVTLHQSSVSLECRSCGPLELCA